jgi:hypothetical protein
MKSYLLKTAFTILILMGVSQAATAQKNVLMLKPDCYTSNKQKGDDYRTLRKFDLAAQQYQAAKYCKGISRVQAQQIDSLISLTRKQQLNSQKVLIRRY